MASYEHRGGNSYRLIVSCGYDPVTGKKKRKTKTVTLDGNLTQKQLEKKLNELTVIFEKEVETGTYLDGGKMTFAQFSEKWLKDYAEADLRPCTLNRYKSLLDRILIAIGHIKLEDIKPIYLMEFYKNLAESGVRKDFAYKIKDGKDGVLSDEKSIANGSGLSPRTIKSIKKGNNAKPETVEKIAAVLNVPIKDVFEIIANDKCLSSKTISHHHKLISAILTSAVQWQFITANPCDRVKPPKVKHKEANYYSLEQLEQLMELLDKEDIKYRAMIYITVYCGLRRGDAYVKHGLKNSELSEAPCKACPL